MMRTPPVGRSGPGPGADPAIARWVERLHEIVADTGDPGADRALDAAVDWIAEVLVHGVAPDPRGLPAPTGSRGLPAGTGSASSCSGAASRLLQVLSDVEAADPDARTWTEQVRELARRLQQHATVLVDAPPPHRLSLSAARVRRAALACRLPRGGPALPFRP